jgi:hypothetical protein
MNKSQGMWFAFSVFTLLVPYVSLRMAAQDLTGTPVSVTTWQQDDPSVCTGTACTERTGSNLAESGITYQNVKPSIFGLKCHIDANSPKPIDGQIYAQPLVVAGVTIAGTLYPYVVYVVTQNDSVYAIDGRNCTVLLGPVPLLVSGESPVDCNNVGNLRSPCHTIAPKIGILGTPVINASGGAGTIYIVAESQSGTAPNFTFYHRLWYLDITTLSTAGSPQPNVLILPPTGCPSGSGSTTFSQLHIQRPGLLLGGDGYVYVAFSMMDGNTPPLPNGMIFAYKTVGLSSTSAPLCLAMSNGATGNDGAGIWQGAAGPAYGPDKTGTSYVYFTTGNGMFDGTSTSPCSAACGDSLVKVWNNPNGGGTGIPALQIAGSFTPVDQYYRSHNTTGCSDGDQDFGSGGVMLIPENEMKDPYVLVHGEKFGGIWFNDRSNPELYHGSSSCTTTGTNANVQTHQINETAPSPVIHTSPAFWDGGGLADYLYIGSQLDTTNSEAGDLMQFTLNTTTKGPIQTAGVAAHDSSNTAITFKWGATPTVSATSATDTHGVVWAIWADGSVEPSPTGGQNGTQAVNGQLYAFDAVTMTKLYRSNDCVVGGIMVDQINPATKFSVPTVADNHVFVGTQGPLCSGNTCNYNGGTFYSFGKVTTRSGCTP